MNKDIESILVSEQDLDRITTELAEKIDEVVAMIDQIRPEYVELWNFRNYEKGIDKFLTHIDNRRKELLALK